MEKLFSVPLKLNSMYLRGKALTHKKKTVGSNVAIIIAAEQEISTDTYFGCFPLEAYKENTTVNHIRAGITLNGTGIIKLLHSSAENSDTKEKILSEVKYDNDSLQTVFLDTSLEDHESGYLYVKVEVAKRTGIDEIWYEADGSAKETKIAVILCTFHREEQVLNNMKTLSKATSSDEMLRESIDVICVDNGRTLNTVPEGTCLIKNRNFGGSGGYARGMLEARSANSQNGTSSKQYTHFWLMDDDIQFEPKILRRAAMFLRFRKYEDIHLAAGMFSFEEPTIQKEATAVFNGYSFISSASGLDFRDKKALLSNRIDTSGNRSKHTREPRYGGWWSCIFPAIDQLPMPFFIKMDDVEFGLRESGRYVIMNGFGVWHEDFSKKGNAWAEYYTTRNTLIIQSMYPHLPRSASKMIGIRLLKALAYGEPKCMEAAMLGVKDYLAGPGALAAIDPEKKHLEIMHSFNAPLAQDMTRKKMLRRAPINLMSAQNRKSIELFREAVRLLKNGGSSNGETVWEHPTTWEDLKTEQFWREYLGLNEKEDADAPVKVDNAADAECLDSDRAYEAKDRPLISVIIPVYNVAGYLNQCLETVCAQTYHNLEIILVDDGSTDNSGFLCDEWAEKDPRIKVIHKSNGGVSSARNEGLKAATGQLIGFVDSDDWLEPEMYEELFNSLQDSGAEVSMCGYVDYPYGTLDEPVNKGTQPHRPCGFEDAIIHIYARNGYFTSLWNKLFRAYLVVSNGEYLPFDTDISVGEDELWLASVIKKSNKNSFVPKALYHYRVRSNSVTNFQRVTERQLSVIPAKQQTLRMIPQTSRVQNLAKSVMYNDCFLMKVTSYCTGDKKAFETIAQELQPMRKYWLKSKDAPFMRKAKVLLMDMEMKLGLPKPIIKYTNSIKRNRLQF